MIVLPPARADALRMLQQASAAGADATWIVGPRLTSDKKCYLGRWDGWELTVRQLGRREQSDWLLDANCLYREQDSLLYPGGRSLIAPLVSLTNISIDGTIHDGTAPLTGTCHYLMDDPHACVITNGALCAQYFRPGLGRSVTAMWYLDTLLSEPEGELRFSFPPLVSTSDTQMPSGTIAVFLQLLTADTWSPAQGCRKVSNAKLAMIRLK